MIAIRIPLRTVNGLNERAHWSVKAKRAKAERKAVGWSMACTSAPPLPVVVTITREGPIRRPLDGDGLQAAGKHVRDAVADWLGTDDGNPAIRWEYAQIKAKEYGVLVEVTTAQDAPATAKDGPKRAVG